MRRLEMLLLGRNRVHIYVYGDEALRSRHPVSETAWRRAKVIFTPIIFCVLVLLDRQRIISVPGILCGWYAALSRLVMWHVWLLVRLLTSSSSIRKLGKFRVDLPTQKKKKKRLLIHHHVEALQSSFLMLLIMSRRGWVFFSEIADCGNAYLSLLLF